MQNCCAHGNSSAELIGVEKVIDFRLADGLLKGNAREHFKCSPLSFEGLY
jgi:hypothetical protein